eukprot:11165190-Lingulodinium_polyedra.AAC.1
MVIEWSSHGHRMVIAWSSNGHRMVIEWSSNGHRMGRTKPPSCFRLIALLPQRADNRKRQDDSDSLLVHVDV